MRAAMLENACYPCPYLPGWTVEMEQFLIHDIDAREHEVLLSYGYRHFGRYYFRPRCTGCGRCVPLRMLPDGGGKHRSWRRVLRRIEAFRQDFDHPPSAEEAFDLYCRHKKRFNDGETPSFQLFGESFFTSHPAARILTLRDGKRLIAVAHFDETRHALSAVYTYYDDVRYARESPGKAAVLLLMRYARERNIRHLYLGYYVHENRAMSYKAQYTPFEYSPTGGVWAPPKKPLNELLFTPGESVLGS